MVIISLEHAEPRIEGYLSRHMLKIRPGIFAGRLSKTRQDLLWDHITHEQPTIDAIMCCDAANNQMSLQTYGNPKRRVIDIDGISLLAFPRPEAWKSFLAKPDKLLWEHSVETAIMAEVFLTESNYKSCLDLLYDQTDKSISRQQFLQSIVFIIGLHDLGKLHPFFQENLLSLPSKTDVRYGFRHEIESGRQLLKSLKKNENADDRTLRMLGRIVKDHHQGKVKSSFDDEAKQIADQSKPYNENVSDMFKYMETMYPFAYFSITGSKNLFCKLLSGVLRFSDWAASSYYHMLSGTSEYYIEDCYKMARRFLQDGGLVSEHVSAAKFDYTSLCGLQKETLYPLQKKLIDVLREHPKAECLLIEDQPGSGKTEGAFYSAIQLLQAYGYNGMYIALPTGATASEMLPRLQKCFQDHGLFQDADAKLLTGNAWLYNTQSDDQSDDDNESKIEWETRSRKLFAPFACGTVDQLMQAGMNFKAGDLRLLALNNKVVVIDEFHAYDAYMMQIIKVVLTWLRSMHVPVIILSATLLNKTRKELVEIYSNETIENTGYPRITCAEAGHVQAYTCTPAKHKEYKCRVISDDVAEKVVESVKSSGNTLYIANTVKKAYHMFQTLREITGQDITIRLYTARTTPNNKDRIGKELVYLYGKNGKAAGDRPSKTIVVSTQIMEMSLDVDFDTVFSELAPADALFQRMGRMARHDDRGTVRENGFQSVFYLVIPEKTRGWNLPYDETVLNGTEKIFTKYSVCSAISIPEDIPEILEASYEEAGDDWMNKILSAHATKHLIAGPMQTYNPKSPTEMSNYSTRYQSYETETILCVPKSDIMQDTCEWARKAILSYSVTIEKRLADKLPTKQDTTKTKWLRNYKIVDDQEDFWGPDKQFIYGL